jgi:SAM-dependent methyltransferase
MPTLKLGAVMANYGENEAQGKFWNDAPGQSWVKHDLVMNLRLGNISDILFDRLKGVSASNALDIGCGTGSTSIKMAETLAQGARVTGIDISEPMLERAREKAADLENVSFVTADAQAFQFEPGKFDAAISRFGVMFFEDPPKAFANLRSAMKPGSQFTFVCWAPYEENEFFSLPLKTVLEFVPSEYELVANAPGPLAFSDKDYLSGILQSSGFSNSSIEVVKTSVDTADTPEEDATLLMQIGFGARAVREAELDQRRTDELYQLFLANSKARQSDGIIKYAATVYIVTATA